jgi:His/Glu/Gln/Arg/opine family amino acid ABC transporter permease subunit
MALVLGLLASPTVARAQAASDDTLVVGLTGKYPPFNYFDESGKLVGFDVDFANELCVRIHRRCEFKPIEWDGLVGALLADKVDVIVGSMAVTPERAKVVRFSVPYYESGARLFVRPGARASDSEGFAIGVTLGTTYEQATRDRFPKANVRLFKGDTDILQDLISGRLDAMVTDDLVGAYMARKRGAILEPAGARLFEERMGIPIKPGRERLLAEIDAAIGDIRASGKQRELLDAHLGAGTSEVTESVWSRAVPLLLEGLLATVWISVAGLGCGMLLSLLLAWATLSRTLIARPVALLVDFVRSTPFVIQLFALYFGPPSLGIQVDARTSAVLAVAIHSAAYLAEVVKTAYQAVPDGQRLAARALGLSPVESLRHVVGPQMLPIAVVPSLNTVVAMIKDSAVVSVIGVYELTLQAQRLISTTFQPLPFYGAACALYFLLTFPLLMLGRRLETNWRKRGLLHG